MRKLFAVGILPLLSAGLLYSSAATAEDILKPTLMGSETFVESYVVIADLQDGSFLKVQQVVSNVGPGDGKGACRAWIAEKGQPLWTDSKIVEREEWNYSQKPEPVLAMGKCTMTGGKNYRIHAQVSGAQIDIEMEASQEGHLMRKVSTFKDGEDFYSLDILAPWLKIKANYQRPGQKMRTSNGFAYFDHSRSTTLPRQLAKRWIRFRGFEEGKSSLVLVREPMKGALSGWKIDQAEAAAGQKAVTRMQVRTQGKGLKKQTKVLLAGEKGPFRIISKELIQRDAPVEEQGMLGKIVGQIIGNPVTYTYRAVLEEKKTRRRLAGIFEITDNN